jgi:hypothetical protein
MTRIPHVHGPWFVALADGKTDGWVVPDVDKLPDAASGRIVRFGRELTVDLRLCGPEVADKTSQCSVPALSERVSVDLSLAPQEFRLRSIRLMTVIVMRRMFLT